MSTKTTFLLPGFDDNIPKKVNDNVEVKSQHVLSIKEAPEYHSAIAISGFSSKTDGGYVFVTKIDRIGDGHLIVGFTDVKAYDSRRNGFPGENPHFTGTGLNCHTGDRSPDWDNYLSSKIALQAKEIISILTISNNGGKKEIQWIGDGNEGPVHDCTKDFGNGDEIFPCISFGFDGQQVEIIPFDQVKSRSPKIDELMKEYSSTKQSKGAVANIFSPTLAQLQQELEKERKCADLAETELKQERQQLHQEKQNSATKDQQLQQRDQLNQQQIAAVANNSNQQQSSVTFAQLQQELEQERKRADLAEQQLQQEQQVNQQQSSEIAQLKQQLLTLQSQFK